MERWTRFVLRHRWPVLGAWLVVFLVAGFASSRLADLLTNRFTLPGTDSSAPSRSSRISSASDRRGRSPSSSRATATRARSCRGSVPQRSARLTSFPPGRLVAVTPLTDDVVSAQIVSELEPPIRRATPTTCARRSGSIPGAEVYMTGQAAIEHDLDPVFGRDLAKGELIAVPIALLILVFTFGTLAFLLPFLFALVTIPPRSG